MVTKRLTREEAAPCARLIFGTALGRGYYPTEEFLRRELERGISEDDCFLATDDGEAVGVVWFQRRGAFRSFPYLHLIVVREDCQGRGFGRALMDFFENEILEDDGRRLVCTNAFLLVNKDNDFARSMYEKRGYREVTELDGLFRRKATEVLMVKRVVRQ
ncbi:GNAT family N-acetyltransferase [Slackia exigua]|uniref:Acetyltransferase, GNAT family n=2 Tax=Eggerthellales TaxID=1643822 RepID=D0WFA6_SLAES|nr:GNAT family N-acetyltransferase [Slackia exigua]EEZ61790.1 acetyltransferase, GNAT family [Slackia exigua ATCC 700122]STN98782.1 putative acetyltransferase [Slackia exigua]